MEHPFLTKREMFSQDELDSSRFHHNAPTGSLPNRPTQQLFFFSFSYTSIFPFTIHFYKANKSRSAAAAALILNKIALLPEFPAQLLNCSRSAVSYGLSKASHDLLVNLWPETDSLTHDIITFMNY